MAVRKIDVYIIEDGQKVYIQNNKIFNIHNPNTLLVDVQYDESDYSYDPLLSLVPENCLIGVADEVSTDLKISNRGWYLLIPINNPIINSEGFVVKTFMFSLEFLKGFMGDFSDVLSLEKDLDYLPEFSKEFYINFVVETNIIQNFQKLVYYKSDFDYEKTTIFLRQAVSQIGEEIDTINEEYNSYFQQDEWAKMLNPYYSYPVEIVSNQIITDTFTADANKQYVFINCLIQKLTWDLKNIVNTKQSLLFQNCLFYGGIDSVNMIDYYFGEGYTVLEDIKTNSLILDGIERKMFANFINSLHSTLIFKGDIKGFTNPDLVSSKIFTTTSSSSFVKGINLNYSFLDFKNVTDIYNLALSSCGTTSSPYYLSSSNYFNLDIEGSVFASNSSLTINNFKGRTTSYKGSMTYSLNLTNSSLDSCVLENVNLLNLENVYLRDSILGFAETIQLAGIIYLNGTIIKGNNTFEIPGVEIIYESDNLIKRNKYWGADNLPVYIYFFLGKESENISINSPILEPDSYFALDFDDSILLDYYIDPNNLTNTDAPYGDTYLSITK